MVHIGNKNEDEEKVDDDKKDDKKEVIEEEKINDAERNHGKITNYDIAKDKGKNNKPYSRNEYIIDSKIFLTSMQLNNIIVKTSNQSTYDIIYLNANAKNTKNVNLVSMSGNPQQYSHGEIKDLNIGRHN